MGTVYEYFSAPDDEAALTACRPGGPAGAGFPGRTAKGIDPCVQLGVAESLLTGVPYDAVVERPRSCHLLGDPEADSRRLLTLSDELRDALAAAAPKRLRETAVPWARTEEFAPGTPPEPLADFLTGLAALASTAARSGHRLYCLATL